MTTRAWLGVLFGGALAAAAFAACSNYVPPDEPNYGPPNGISGKTPPAVSGTSSGGSSSGTTGGGSSSGSSSGAGTSSGTAPQYLCQQQGGALVDGGACAVSFANDIYPKMGAAGAWACATAVSCHGGAQPPRLTTATPADFYAALANFAFPLNGNTVPYVNPCSTDPTKSAFACDTLATGTTGACAPQMPISPAIPTADQQKIATWVACGAPLN